jgi:hypothetical protein
MGILVLVTILLAIAALAPRYGVDSRRDCRDRRCW